MSLAETLRLINVIRSHISAAGKQFLLDWSTWRREHQAIARWYHRRARLALATAGSLTLTNRITVTLRDIPENERTATLSS